MSAYAKHFAKAKLSSLPPPEPLPEEAQDYEDDSSSASSMSSTGTIIPTSTQRPAPAIHWSDHFAQELYLEQDRPGDGHAKFHVYVTPPASPNAPLLVLHHGAGSSAMSFALMAKEIKTTMPDIGILAVEARDHGSVVWDAKGAIDTNLSVELLSQDLVDMILLTKVKLDWPVLPTILLVGHSLGGAVVTYTANTSLLKIMGYAVFDVVEGSAMETLQHMQTYLASRPKSFPSLPSAIEWHIRSRTIRNPQSARASVPSLLLQTDEGRWAWKTNLGSTQPYWENWFTGMSGKFLSGRGAKLLVLAGTDRLDKELMIGQMQGKFQLQIFPASGHFLHEDQPDKTADVVVEFVKRNDRSTLVLPPKFTATPKRPTMSLPEYKQKFLKDCVSADALKFGTFTLKSKRVSPYFFNAGLFNSAELARSIASAYAHTLDARGKSDASFQWDVLFGPAYKGIPLASTTVTELDHLDNQRYGKKTFYSFNRKEAKDHGEGGSIVGASLKGKKIVIIDDVITAGTAIREAIDIIKREGGELVGIIVAFDRQEKTPTPTDDDGKPGPSAIGEVRKKYGIPVLAILTLDDVVKYLRGLGSEDDLKRLDEYRAKYKASD